MADNIYISIAGIIVPTAVFCAGLLQYARAQSWKRYEFIVDQIKEFKSNPSVRNAMQMIDWGKRDIELATNYLRKLKGKKPFAVRIHNRITGNRTLSKRIHSRSSRPKMVRPMDHSFKDCPFPVVFSLLPQKREIVHSGRYFPPASGPIVHGFLFPHSPKQRETPTMIVRRCLLFMAALVAFSMTATATNQPLTWNSPCATMTVRNLTSCASTITLNLYGGGTFVVSVPAFAATTVLTPTMRILGVKTLGLNNIPIVLTPNFPPAFPVMSPALNSWPANGYIQAATTGSGCCVDMYFYTTNHPNYPCQVFLYPASAPCVP